MKAERNHARLYRSSDDVVIAGVCAGVADYLGLPSERCGWRRCSWYWSAVCRFGFISCCGSSYPKVPNGSKGIPGRPNPGQPGNCPGKELRISDMRTGPGAET